MISMIWSMDKRQDPSIQFQDDATAWVHSALKFLCTCSLIRSHCSGCPFPPHNSRALRSATQGPGPVTVPGQARDRCARAFSEHSRFAVNYDWPRASVYPAGHCDPSSRRARQAALINCERSTEIMSRGLASSSKNQFCFIEICFGEAPKVAWW